MHVCEYDHVQKYQSLNSERNGKYIPVPSKLP